MKVNRFWALAVRHGVEEGPQRDEQAVSRLSLIPPNVASRVDLFAGFLAAMAEAKAGASLEDAQRVGWSVVERLAQPGDPQDSFDRTCRGWRATAARVERAVLAARYARTVVLGRG